MSTRRYKAIVIVSCLDLSRYDMIHIKCDNKSLVRELNSNRQLQQVPLVEEMRALRHIKATVVQMAAGIKVRYSMILYRKLVVPGANLHRG